MNKEMEPLLIYIHKNNNRINYIFNFIFNEIIGTPIKFCFSADEFKEYGGAKISYSYHPFDNSINFVPHGLLNQIGIEEQNIHISEFDGMPCFFQVQSTGVLPFDPFAASFYLVTRYEEYLPFIKDEYSRFTPEHSLAYEHDFITIPIVDYWANMVQRIIEERYPACLFKKREFMYVPSIDIDNAWQYKHKGLMRNIGGYFKSLSRFDFRDIIDRTSTILNTKPDPYDSFNTLAKLHRDYCLNAKYFFLLANYGTNDKNISRDNVYFQRLIKSTDDYFQIGIHPSFASNSDVKLLREELNALSNIIHRRVNLSRQHFLMLSMPETYRNLIKMDITDDYTMGYASALGFRAGTCTSFLFYDLDYETQTKLRIHPFQIMDATLKYYLKIEPEDVIAQVESIIENVKAVRGTLVTLWHNESLSGVAPWEGWESVYHELIKKIMS